jgi:GTP-binding protein
VALDLHRIARTEVPTPKLNKTLEEAERRHEPPVVKTRKPRLLYGVQVTAGPPTFVIYCRYADYIDDKYKRFLSRYLREHLDLEEVPIRIFLRQAPRDKKKK